MNPRGHRNWRSGDIGDYSDAWSTASADPGNTSLAGSPSVALHSEEQLEFEAFRSPSQRRMAQGCEEERNGAQARAPEVCADTLNNLFSEVYQELRGIARTMVRTSAPNRTLQPTVLVHEAYLRLRQSYCDKGVNRSHFFGAAAESMRRILVEDSRRRMTLRRGGRWARIPLEHLRLASEANLETLVSLDEALHTLSIRYPLEAQVIRLIFFGGLTAAEAGKALNLCDRTVKRHWAFARAWLYKELAETS